MNYGRIAAAAIAAAFVDAVYGFLVYGMLLTGSFAQYPGVYRPQADTSYMPFLFAGILLATVAASCIYAKGYEGGAGIQEGLRFGALIGLFSVGYTVVVNYATMNIGPTLASSMAAAAFVEWLLVGMVIGAVYRPAVRSRP